MAACRWQQNAAGQDGSFDRKSVEMGPRTELARAARSAGVRPSDAQRWVLVTVMAAADDSDGTQYESRGRRLPLPAGSPLPPHAHRKLSGSSALSTDSTETAARAWARGLYKVARHSRWVAHLPVGSAPVGTSREQKKLVGVAAPDAIPEAQVPLSAGTRRRERTGSVRQKDISISFSCQQRHVAVQGASGQR